MKVSIFAGKGGVGKSTSAAAYSLSRASDEKVLIIDYDGGHSIGRILGLQNRLNSPSNKIVETEIQGLDLAVVNKFGFQSIGEAKQFKVPIGRYLEQFNGNYGLLPFHDMITEFFGAVTDINSVSYFATLTDLFEQANQKGTKHIVLDVEPTAGLERLLSSTKAITRSFRNLQNWGTLKRAILGQAWPDIRAFLDGNYIQKADIYAPKLDLTAQAIREATYHLVCIPEQSPVAQMVEVKQLVESYGGQVKEYIINNVRGEDYEQEHIDKVVDFSKQTPVTIVNHNVALHFEDIESRRRLLKQIGQKFV